mmetsp:Transcript_3029/g.5688  ORF Transcript_3029/g.5688 Transcript_3029/m.5688 type:complete len:390 (-) Transcript_3029:80-1249(-)
MRAGPNSGTVASVPSRVGSQIPEYSATLQHGPKRATPQLSLSYTPTGPLQELALQHSDRHRKSILGWKLFGDLLSATTVTLGIAPVITVIDKAIVENAAGQKTLFNSVGTSLRNMATKPVKFFKSPMFLLMWGTYSSTYAAANSIRTLTEEWRVGHSQSQSSLFVGTTIVNSGTTMLKDRAYAKMFGASEAAARAIPKITYGFWATRDLLVIGSSFVMPRIVGERLVADFGIEEGRAGKIAQFSCPILTQFIAGPIQLLGLDFYNRPMCDLGWRAAALSRLEFLKSQFWTIVGCRIARIAPAYGIGGIGNTYFRDSWREMILQNEVSLVQERMATTMAMRTERGGEEADIDDYDDGAEAKALVDMVLKEQHRQNERRVMRADLLENWDL